MFVYFFSYFPLLYMYKCLSVYNISVVPKKARRQCQIPLRLKLQLIVSCNVGFRIPAQVF